MKKIFSGTKNGNELYRRMTFDVTEYASGDTEAEFEYDFA